MTPITTNPAIWPAIAEKLEGLLDLAAGKHVPAMELRISADTARACIAALRRATPLPGHSAELRTAARALAAQVREECERSFDCRRGTPDRDWELEDPDGHTLVVAVETALAAESRLPEVVCICGSTRFIQQMAVIGWTLEKEGAIVVGLHLLPDDYPGVQADHQAEAEGVKERMDALHLKKIDLADRIFVVNIGGYIGESTSHEIEYAESQGKPVIYLERRQPAPAPEETHA